MKVNMTIERWRELDDYLLSISVGGEEIGEGNGCYRVDDSAYVAEMLYEEAFKNDLEELQWATICNLQTVNGLSLKDATENVNGLSREDLEKMAGELATDEDACVYYTEGWDD